MELIDNESGSGDGFASLRNDNNSAGTADGSLIDDVNGGKTNGVDLLNMGTASVTEAVDLLNIGGDPSNVDLLDGHTGKQPQQTMSKEPDLLGISNPDADSFDPFAEFSAARAPSPAKPATQSQPNNTFDPFQNAPSQKSDTFDPFQSSNTTANSSSGNFDPFNNFSSSSQAAPTPAPVNTKPQNNEDEFIAFFEDSGSNKSQEPDLMKSWDTNSIQNLSGHNYSSVGKNMDSLGVNPGMIPKSASTGSNMFQGMMNPSQASGQQMGMGQVPKADPFAELGKELIDK